MRPAWSRSSLREAAGFIGERIDLVRRLLLAHAAEQVGGFLQAIGGAARFGFALLRRSCAAHVVGRLAQPVKSLLHARVARFSIPRPDCPDEPDCPEEPEEELPCAFPLLRTRLRA